MVLGTTTGCGPGINGWLTNGTCGRGMIGNGWFGGLERVNTTKTPRSNNINIAIIPICANGKPNAVD